MVVVSAVAAILIFYIHRRRDIAKQLAYMKQMTHRMAQGSTCVNADFAMVWYSLDEIKAATHNFARERVLGSGGFANVYRGVLEDQTDIAVKRFKNCSPTGVDDFVREVEALASVKHKNLVTLRGCCIATVGTGVEADHQRIIVCDFMENGSLHNFLFSPASAAAAAAAAAAPDVESKSRFLDWPTRQKIAIDMARGIDYLHHGVQPPILHRDIKSSNILLDSNFNARVADFGLAKFAPEGMTHMITRTAGTFGYIAPEYAL
jgi:serine/threonine protein kinase